MFCGKSLAVPEVMSENESVLTFDSTHNFKLCLRPQSHQPKDWLVIHDIHWLLRKNKYSLSGYLLRSTEIGLKEYFLANALVASKLPQLPIVWMEDASLPANTHQRHSEQ